jgi:NAD(P)-dependent dehydrogenase (short-subunit alcohol dehydrogenase family)
MTGTILITGANGSLALGFIQSLILSHPSYTLIATVRNTSPSSDPNTARLINLITKHPKTRVLLEHLDLGSLSSVRSFAETITAKIAKRELPPISAIICNAFTWSLTGQRSTSDGYEATFQVSHLSHWLLVLKLLGSMDKTAGRVVMIGSNAHYPERANPLSKLRAKFPEDDMEELVRPGEDGVGEVHDRGFQRYGTSKLANVVFVEDLNARLLAVSFFIIDYCAVGSIGEGCGANTWMQHRILILPVLLLRAWTPAVLLGQERTRNKKRWSKRLWVL